MNLVLIEPHPQWNFQSESEVSAKLHIDGVSTTVIFIDWDCLAAENYNLSIYNEMSKSTISKVIIITKFTSGLLGSHVDLIMANCEYVQNWYFAITDIQRPAYQEQFVEQINMQFSECPFVVRSYFDNSEDFRQTKDLLSKKKHPNRLCAILTSGSKGLLHKSDETLKYLRPEWENICIHTDESGLAQNILDDADQILIIGDKPDDFEVPPVSTGISRIRIWLNNPLIGQTAREQDEYINKILEQMRKCGWLFTSIASRFGYGDLMFERIHAELSAGKISPASLRDNQYFIMWDQYGLPVGKSEYTDAKMKDFLLTHVQLAKLLGIKYAVQESKGEVKL